MNTEEKIFELENRLLKLEKIEKRRRIWGIIQTIIRILVTIAFVILSIYAYKNVSKIVANYRQQVAEISKISGSIKEVDELNKILEKLFPEA
ncbi:MAG: hypothetical protein GX951_03680 [Mollicutes bacterium]|nr:hypothetical protein [Mollicutes bacterium]